jgi:hypothetical protein
MNLRKLSISILVMLVSGGMAFSQLKDDVLLLRSNDPIKLVQIYPNPASEVVNVKFDAPISKKIKLTVHNVIGNVMDLETEIMDDHEIRVKVKDLATGYYLISVKDEQNNTGSTFKFLKR